MEIDTGRVLLVIVAIALMAYCIIGLFSCIRVIGGGEIKQPNTLFERVAWWYFKDGDKRYIGTYTQTQLARMWLIPLPLGVLMGFILLLMALLG